MMRQAIDMSLPEPAILNVDQEELGIIEVINEEDANAIAIRSYYIQRL